jgi:hypothetical protein
LRHTGLARCSRRSKVLNGRLPLLRCFGGLWQANDVTRPTLASNVLRWPPIASIEQRVCSRYSRRWRSFRVGHYQHECFNRLTCVFAGEFPYLGDIGLATINPTFNFDAPR